MTNPLEDTDTYEVIVVSEDTKYDEDEAWLAMAEEVDWENLPEYLEPVREHELCRQEAEALEGGELSDEYFSQHYGGD